MVAVLTGPVLAVDGGLKAARRYGHNYRMTEMQAVLLRGGLTRIEEQTAIREERAQQIREGLEQIGGPLRAARRDPRITRQAYYAMTLVYNASKADGLCRDGFNHAVAGEWRPLSWTYDPVYRNPLLNLYDQTSPIPFRDPSSMQDYRNLRLPSCEAAFTETALLVPHEHLLGSQEYIDQILTAIRKVTDNIPAAKTAWEKKKGEKSDA